MQAVGQCLLRSSLLPGVLDSLAPLTWPLEDLSLRPLVSSISLRKILLVQKGISGQGGGGRPSAGRRKGNMAVYHPDPSPFFLPASRHPVFLPPPPYSLLPSRPSARLCSGHRAVAVRKAETSPLVTHVFMCRGASRNPEPEYISRRSSGG